MPAPTPLSRRTFARALRGLSGDEFVAFVADLYAAQGWTVERSGRRLVLARTDPTTEERTLAVVPSRRVGRQPRPEGPVDAVVAARPTQALRAFATDHDAEVLGPGDLYEQTYYALDRETCRRLFREHLDREPLGVSPLERLRTAWAGALAAGREVRPGVAVAVALAAILVAVAAASGGVPGGPLAAPDRPDPTTTTFRTVPPPTPATAGERTATVSGPTLPSVLQAEPSCERSSREVLGVAIGALEYVEGPDRERALSVLWSFLAPGAREEVGSRETFGELLAMNSYAAFVDPARLEYAEVGRTGDSVRWRVTVWTEGGLRGEYAFELAESPAGCWGLRRVLVLQGPRPVDGAGTTTPATAVDGGNQSVLPDFRQLQNLTAWRGHEATCTLLPGAAVELQAGAIASAEGPRREAAVDAAWSLFTPRYREGVGSRDAFVASLTGGPLSTLLAAERVYVGPTKLDAGAASRRVRAWTAEGPRATYRFDVVERDSCWQVSDVVVVEGPETDDMTTFPTATSTVAATTTDRNVTPSATTTDRNATASATTVVTTTGGNATATATTDGG